MNPARTKLPPVDHIERTRRLYSSLGYEPYRWVHSSDPVPFSPLEKPLSQCRVALIGSGGVYRAGQVAFHHHDDISLREIDVATPRDELRVTHFAYDLSAARRDVNSVLPLDTLQRAQRRGRIGTFVSPAYTFMGGIYSARKVREKMAPVLRERLGRAEVDVAVLVPV